MTLGDKLGGEIAKIFGIKNCRRLKIDLEAGHLAIVEAEFFIDLEDGEKIETILKKYQLMEIKESV